MCTMLVLPSLIWVLSALALSAEHKRDFLGLLDGDGDASNALRSPDSTRHTPKSSSTTPLSQSARPTLATSQSSQEQRTPTPTPRTDSAQPTAANTALTPTSILPASAESHPTDRSNKTWQIIGITITVVLFIATSIACAMFFDRLCSFLKDVVCCTSRPFVSEQFIPDCEKQSYFTRTDRNMAESLSESASVRTIRPRQLPWNTDSQDWNTLYRHPSRRKDHPPPA